MKSRIILPFLAALFTSSVNADPLPAPPGLIGWWPAENAGTTQAAAPAAVLTSVTQAAGKIGNAWQFTNSAQSAESSGRIPDSLLMRPAAFTIALWCRFDVFDTYSTADDGLQYLVFQRGSGLFESYSVCKLREPSEQFLFTFGPASNDRFGITSNIPGGIQLNTWYFVTATFDSTVAKIYVNGTLTNSLPTGFQIGYRNNADTFLGSSGLAYNGVFGGRMDELSLFNRVLTAAEITALYNAPDGITLPDDSAVTMRPVSDIAWPGRPGQMYQLESSPDMVTWAPCGPPVTGNGDNHICADTNAARRYYRVNRVP